MQRRENEAANPSSEASSFPLVDFISKVSFKMSCKEFKKLFLTTICGHHKRMILPLGREHSHGKTQYIPGKQVLVSAWLWKTNKQKHPADLTGILPGLYKVIQLNASQDNLCEFRYYSAVYSYFSAPYVLTA